MGKTSDNNNKGMIETIKMVSEISYFSLLNVDDHFHLAHSYFSNVSGFVKSSTISNSKKND